MVITPLELGDWQGQVWAVNSGRSLMPLAPSGRAGPRARGADRRRRRACAVKGERRESIRVSSQAFVSGQTPWVRIEPWRAELGSQLAIPVWRASANVAQLVLFSLPWCPSRRGSPRALGDAVPETGLAQIVGPMLANFLRCRAELACDRPSSIRLGPLA